MESLNVQIQVCQPMVAPHGLEPWSITALVLEASVFTNFTIGPYISWFRLYFTVINGFLNLAILFYTHKRLWSFLDWFLNGWLLAQSSEPLLFTVCGVVERSRKATLPLGHPEGLEPSSSPWKGDDATSLSSGADGATEGNRTPMRINPADFKSDVSHQFHHSGILWFRLHKRFP